MNTHMDTPKNRKSSFQTLWKLETGWKLEFIKNNALGLNLVSNWKLDLETWKLAESPVFLRDTDQILVSSLSPTPNGVVGNHHRLRLVTPTSAIGTNNQPIPKTSGDASDQERHRHPHHIATKGKTIWII